ncbi:ATP-binding protein [Hymenobacter sp. GOD-10R]|uniref:PAS domain-containing sensor histidine kinase n=1 Tax=Hymenobacter sp. GOD-10R TaxID=3093922 RepID=UPI002D779D41|nr:ATP-binding protein [Hymenobacter sp. GOD-10R]WRQ26961.1 ATP-binding protein [Hymenobacter sp. GOD-10R]
MSDYLALLRPFIARSQAVQFVYQLATQRIVYVSEAYEQVVGDPIAHVNEDLPRWLQRLHPDDWQLLRHRFAEAQLEEMVENIELRVMQPNGGTQWLCLSACQVCDSDGQAYLTGRLEDITKVKENGINAEKFNAKKNATLEILAHDLAAPLALLQQLTEFLSDEVQADQSSVTQQLLTLMQRTCTQSVTLIRDFVDNEFLESSSVVLNLKRTDMVVWARTLVAEYQHSEAHMHLHFEYHAPEHPVYVEVDINKFQQVLNNLLSNAIKFTPDGGHIAVSLTQEDGQVVITVTDTGLGIPAHLQPVLFDKFTKARRPGLRGEHTTGLGMSVIQTLVHLHHGRITVASEEGLGTTIRIELPILPA